MAGLEVELFCEGFSELLVLILFTAVLLRVLSELGGFGGRDMKFGMVCCNGMNFL